ncbi:MAG: hypothetical protein P1V81_12315 [Planctomycetota bacterium]|nr:hypothetical protein [Planctomycetota bacterium]
MPHPSQPVALVADLVSSRTAPDRAALAERIEATLTRLAGAAPGTWLAPPQTTRGLDEVSGVLASAGPAFDLALALNEAVWPAVFRVAVADGELDVRAQSGDAGAMDGPAFHRAADALARAESEGLDFALDLAGLSLADRELVEATAALHASLRTTWKPSRHRAVVARRRHGTQRAAAEALGITPQTISTALQAAHYEALCRSERAIRGVLEGA